MNSEPSISAPLSLSVVVPAYNEEKLITGCLVAIREALCAARRNDDRSEIIVVDNNSSDATASLAEEAGAKVVFEPKNQIARARNAGADAAQGEWLLFVDADSYPTPGLMKDLFATLRSGTVVGGGCLCHMPGLPWPMSLMVDVWNAISRTCSWAAGSFVFCRADAFREVGGFSDELYASEEIDLSRRLKRFGRRQQLRFVILQAHPLETSDRKGHLYSGREMFLQLSRFILRPRRALKSRDSLEVWYDGRR